MVHGCSDDRESHDVTRRAWLPGVFRKFIGRPRILACLRCPESLVVHEEISVVPFMEVFDEFSVFA